MTRKTWLWLAVTLLGAALAATFVFAPKQERSTSKAGPAPTPFGWTAHLEPAAGDGVRGFREGPVSQARFADPYGIAVAADGTRYVADAGDNNRIRRIGVDGMVATLAGSQEGFADGTAAAAQFDTPSGLALDDAGNLYVADTGNHAIRRITPQGVVSTLAGTGVAGFRDGPGAQAQFNGPVGVAVDGAGNVYVADTYNDRIRKIGRDGAVATLAGGELPGYQDGVGNLARFDTPTGLAVDATGTLWIADTRNNAIRRLSAKGEATTLYRDAEDVEPILYRPIAIAVTRDGMLYVGEMAHGRVMQLSRAGQWHVLTGATQDTRLSRPAGLAVDASGAVHVADAASYRVHRIVPLAERSILPTGVAVGPAPENPLPDTGGRWPLRPQDGWHEVVGTLGEVRGNYQHESRDHLHSGLDIRGDVGAEVLAIADGKVSSPSASWGLGQLGEGIEIGELSYIHMRVGRNARDEVADPARFPLLPDAEGNPDRVRVQRGTRFKAGDVLGSINRMAHVHLSVGASGFERNAVALGFAHYADSSPPRIDSIELFDAMEQPLTVRQNGRVVVPRETQGVQIVVDAWDQVDRNLPRRRLGLHAMGYQVLGEDGVPVAGYESPLMNIEFNRMPADDEAVKIAYAQGSGITVHGSATTHFRYMLTNTVRDGRLATGSWPVAGLPPGDYTLRITARDYSNNVAAAGRDLKITLQ